MSQDKMPFFILLLPQKRCSTTVILSFLIFNLASISIFQMHVLFALRKWGSCYVAHAGLNLLELRWVQLPQLSRAGSRETQCNQAQHQMYINVQNSFIKKFLFKITSQQPSKTVVGKPGQLTNTRRGQFTISRYSHLPSVQ